MERRNFVKAIVAAAAAPQAILAQTTGQNAGQAPLQGAPAPVPSMTGIQHADAISPNQPPAETLAQSELRFFTAAQMATLSRLSEVLVPATRGFPSAVQAETPAFLDFFIGESAPDLQRLYQGGLDWLDAQSVKQFSKPFATLDTAQADNVIRPWLRTWMPDHLPAEPHADFINAAHTDIRTATVNSPAWNAAASTGPGKKTANQGLFWSPIQPDIYRDLLHPIHAPGTTRKIHI